VSPPSIRTAALRAEQFTKGDDIGVDVTQIERELASLWRSVGQASSGEASSGRAGSPALDKAVTRACSWNLLVHVAAESELDDARALVDKVVFPVPSRAIVLVPRAGDGAAGQKDIEAFVSANCQVAPGGGKLLCSEEITIMSRAGGERHVPSLVRALLVPDVPAALYWVGPPPADPRSIPYLPSVDRIVFDSARAPWESRGAGGAADVASAKQMSKDYASLPQRLADLAWLRMGYLRSMLASMFDPPTGAGPLERATEIVVRGARTGGSAARLFACWVASRLGWSLSRLDGGGGEGTARNGRRVSIKLEHAERDTPTGIVEVVIRTTDASGAAVEYGLSDTCDGSLAVRAPGQVSRSKIAADLTLDRLVIAALGARGRDPLYRAALALSAMEPELAPRTVSSQRDAGSR
jgi:glucose-6-phosphate dehydrogenase assembly protein OpcA